MTNHPKILLSHARLRQGEAQPGDYSIYHLLIPKKGGCFTNHPPMLCTVLQPQEKPRGTELPRTVGLGTHSTTAPKSRTTAHSVPRYEVFPAYITTLQIKIALNNARCNFVRMINICQVHRRPFWFCPCIRVD